MHNSAYDPPHDYVSSCLQYFSISIRLESIFILLYIYFKMAHFVSLFWYTDTYIYVIFTIFLIKEIFQRIQ